MKILRSNEPTEKSPGARVARSSSRSAQRFDADLVCLALDERPTFLTRFFGSQIRRVLTNARRSLLIVRSTRA